MASRGGLDSKSPSVAVWLLPQLADIGLWWQRSYLNVAGRQRLDLLSPFASLPIDFLGKLPLPFARRYRYSLPVVVLFGVEVEAA